MKKNTVLYTNEKLSKRFKSNFELVNYAIHVAEDRIRAGRDSGNQQDNLVGSIISDLGAGRDILQPIIIDVIGKEDGAEYSSKELNSKEEPAPIEKKKGKRKIIHDKA